MAASTIRKEVHQYVDEADNTILEVVHKMLEVYRKTNASHLTYEQQLQAQTTSTLYKAGKIKTFTTDEVHARIKKKLVR